MGQRRVGAGEGKPRLAKEYRLLIGILMVSALVGGAVGVKTIFAQNVASAAPLDLTGVNNFAILANTYTNTGEGTVLNGDLGYTVPPANPPTVNGTTFTATTHTYISAETIQANLIAFANDPTQSGPCTTTRTAATVLDSLPQPLTPGVYCIAGAVSIDVLTTLSGDGVYIFRLGGALTTVASSTLKLAGNARADNIFWAPVGATTLGARSLFAGNVLSDAAITVGRRVSMDGRILSNGAVTTGPSVTINAHKGVPPPADTTPPVITLLGPNPQIIQVGGVYTEFGAVVSDPDNVGLAAMIDSSSVNTGVVGSYLVTYDAVDPAGNHATQVTRIVSVASIALSGPVITLSDQASCQTLGGAWTIDSSTCTVSTLTINSGNTLVIASNVTFRNTGLITDLGTITNSGPIVNTGTITIGPTGILTTTNTFGNTGTITSSGTVTNNGPVTNGPTGTITSSGLITNSLTGTITNLGTITNSGPVTNAGTMTNSGTITNGPTGVITDSGTIINENAGIITTSGTITLPTSGKLTNELGGTVTNSLNIINSGNITNSGVVVSSGPITNSATGTIGNTASGVITNSGILTTAGTIINSGHMTNSGPITNSGTIINSGPIINSAMITNSGTITDLCGGSIIGVYVVVGNPIVESCP